MLKAITTTLLLVCLSLYPFIVYFGLQHISIRQVSLVLMVLLGLRLLLSKKLLTSMPWIKPASIWAIIALATTQFFNNDLGLKLYPVIINTVMAITFAYSLKSGPTVIESFARIKEPELDEKEFFGSPVIPDLVEFKLMSDIIVANRKSVSLKDVDEKCFSRDLFGDN